MRTSKYDVVAMGPINIDVHVPYSKRTPEYTHLVDSIKLSMGGGAIITSVALATLEERKNSVAIAGSIGDDIVGDIIQDKLEKEGVKTFLKKYPIGTAISQIDLYPSGKKGIVASIESNKCFTPDDLKEIYPYVNESRVIFRTGLPWQPQLIDATIELFYNSKKNGIITAIGMSSPRYWDQELLKKLYYKLLPKTEWLCLNRGELYVLGGNKYDPKKPKEEVESYMTPERSLEYGRRLLEKGIDIINLHMGKEGTMLIKEDDYVHEKPRIRFGTNGIRWSAVYSAGSGNVQDAGFIRGILNGWDIDYVADYANKMAELRLKGIEFSV